MIKEYRLYSTDVAMNNPALILDQNGICVYIYISISEKPSCSRWLFVFCYQHKTIFR